MSRLTVTILSVNIIPLLTLVVGFLLLGQYRDSLIEAELKTMKVQAQLYAAAIAEGAIRSAPAVDRYFYEDHSERLIPELSRRMIRRLAEASSMRTRLYNERGFLLGDTHRLRGPGGVVQIMELEPDPRNLNFMDKTQQTLTDWTNSLFTYQDLPVYTEDAPHNGYSYRDVALAMDGYISASAWKHPNTGLLLTASAPVQRVKQVMGAVFISRDGQKIEDALGRVRLDALKIFAAVLVVTVFLSLQLSNVIARPLRKLAHAAEIIRSGKSGRDAPMPDLSGRHDEIGELSLALREMTSALWARMDTIERFAADVSHEIKNPLTSVRSAVETALRLDDTEKRNKLLKIIDHDVQRLDRLISDISSASRLDAELSRVELMPVNIVKTIENLIDFNRSPLERAEPGEEDHFNIRLHGHVDQPLYVAGNEDRLVQVFQNLISNALSFSPKDGVVHIYIENESPKNTVLIRVEDEGPGIPETKIETIFSRFYTERPGQENFGNHSGLGLSIAKQIIDAHKGEIFARNRLNKNGQKAGASFHVRVLRADPKS